MRKENDFPEVILAKWQKLIDLLSSTFDLPATLIMQANKDTMEVFASSNTENNPYGVGDTEEMAGLYCETVIQSEAKLIVPNALTNSQWDKNPDIKLGMIAYLGFPLKYPDGEIFGTICVLDNKENAFSKTIENFLLQVKEIVELDIATYCNYQKARDLLDENTKEEFQTAGKKNKSVIALIEELNRQKHIQRLLEEKLSDSERKYKSIFNESHSIMLLLDPKDGGIVDANASAVKFYGYSRKILLNMNMHDINVMSVEELKKEIALATQKKKNHFQFKHRLASGDIRDVEVYSGTIIADGQTLLHSVIHDVTERRIAREEVNRLSMAVEQSPVSIVITDILGNILYCNPKHCEITGYSDEEMIGVNPRVFKSGKYNKDDYSQLWKSISSGKKWSGEFLNKKKNGSFYWESASIAPIKNDEGKIVNYIKIGEDITDRKRLENQLSQSILKAQESDKLKSSFLSNLSHEVRTPLNGILGFTNLIISDDITDEERKEYGAFVESSGNQLLMMVDDILKISTIEAGKMSIKYSTFNIKDLLLEIEAYYSQEAIDKGLVFKIECNCESLIYNDKKRVRQIFDNLIRNAIKFTEIGTITIGAECNMEMLILSVKDTGIGLARENQLKIFERFHQVDNYTTREFEGTGLGLAISKEIVTLLGGDIWVESKVGKGAKFIFTIPKVKEGNK